jgi:hypothetical protein
MRCVCVATGHRCTDTLPLLVRRGTVAQMEVTATRCLTRGMPHRPYIRQDNIPPTETIPTLASVKSTRARPQPRTGAAHEHRMRAQAAQAALRRMGLQEYYAAVHQAPCSCIWPTCEPEYVPCRIPCRAGYRAVPVPCRAGYGRYLTWLKRHLVLSHPVVMFIFCKGDSHAAHGDEVRAVLCDVLRSGTEPDTQYPCRPESTPVPPAG